MADTNPSASVSVNEQPPVPAASGASLLTALQAQNIFVPSACGGHGVCGLCRVQLRGSSEPCSAKEKLLLSETERQAGYRLACQTPVKGNLHVNIPADWLRVREYKGQVTGKRKLTDAILELTIRLTNPSRIDFQAGQFIQLRIPPYGTSRRFIHRAYSIASPPAAREQIELEIKRVRNGTATTYIFDHLKQGMPVVFNGPYGDFCLRTGARAALCIAGGSGMAPIKSMLFDALDKGNSRRIRYFFGAEKPADLFLLDQMHELEQKLPDFRFIPVLSGATPADQWRGETGLVTEALERRLDPEAGRDSDAYLCGSPAMINACLKILRQKCFPEDRIYYDKFTS